MSSPETPILRLFVTFFRFTGIYLLQPRLNSLVATLNLLFNLFIDAAVVYALYNLDPFRFKALGESCAKDTRPLFETYLFVGPKYTYTINFAILVVYIVKKGHLLVRLLDAPCLSRHLQSKQRAVAIFAVVTVVNHLSFVAALHELRQDQLGQRDYLSYLAVYVIFNQQYLLCLVLHYAQHGTDKSLKEIEWKVHWGYLELEKALEHLGEIAATNRRINEHLSLPMICYLVINIFNTILIACINLNCKAHLGMLAHQLLLWVYVLVVVHLNRANVQLMLRICGHLEENCERQHLQNRQLRLTEATNLYPGDLSLNAFHLYRFNGPFTLHVALFILSYVVFFTQTT